MKWFLQFLSLGSVVLYTLLVIIDNRIPDGIADNTVASEAHSNQHRLSAWGPHLLTGLLVKIGKLQRPLSPLISKMRPSHQNPIGRAPGNISMTSLHQTRRCPDWEAASGLAYYRRLI